MIQSLSIAIRSPALWLAVFVALLCIGLHFSGMAETWRYDRALIESGQWHSLLTGNFVHLGANHMWMNMAGFALIVALVWQHFKAWEWTIVILFSSLIVTAGLYAFDKHVLYYVGFSGTLHGIIIAGCMADIRHFPKSASVLLALVVGKLAWEQFSGPLPGSEEMAGGNVEVNSHLYGAIGGAIIASVLLARQWIWQPQRTDRTT